MKNHGRKKLGSKQNSLVTTGPSRTLSSQTITSCLNHGLVVRQVGQPSSLLPGAFKSDVLLSNVHLVSAIQSPVLWPSEGILRQALIGSDKNLKGNDKISVTAESASPSEQSTNQNTTLVAISMAPQTPLITTSLPSQVIVLGELGTNQIILAGPGFSHVVPFGSGLSNTNVFSPGISHLTSEVGDPACKQIDVESTTTDLEQNASDLLVIDDHNSFGSLTIGSSVINNINGCTNPVQNMKDNLSVIQDKVFNTEQSHNIVHVRTPHHHSETLPDLISQHHGNNTINDNDDHGNDNTNIKRSSGISNATSNSSTTSHASFSQDNHVPDVEHHTPDGSGELGYTAHLLSQLSDTRTLPTMSSSQVSSVLSALEPVEKSAQSSLGSLDSITINKQKKSTVKHDVHSTSPPSLEFVKVESNIPDVSKPAVTKRFDSDKAVSQGYKVVMVNSIENQKRPLFKCVDCGFLTLKETVMETHCQKMHNNHSANLFTNGRKEIKCIGCSNIFHSKQALQVHLIQDHGVCTSEVASMVSTIVDYVDKEETGVSLAQTTVTNSGSIGQITSNSLANSYHDKELLLYSPPHKRAHTTASVTTNSVITAASAQSISSLPSLGTVVRSSNDSVMSSRLTATTGIKPISPPLPAPPSSSTTASTTSELLSITSTLPVLTPPQSSNLTTIVSATVTTNATTVTAVTTTSTTTTTTTASSISPIFSVFIRSADSLFADHNLDKDIFSENNAEKNENNGLKNERELKDSSVEEAVCVDLVNSGNSVNGESLNKKRGRPRGSQTIRLVRTKFQSSEIKHEKDVGFRCIGFRCGLDGCAIRLQNETNMEYHRQCHTGKSDDAFQCPECPFTATQWSRLTSHLWKMHKIDMELYTCDQCGYKTNSHSKLVNLHNRIHGEERPFLCDLCGKGFKTPKQLRNHKAIHRVPSEYETNPLSCEICGRKVSDARNLRLHTENVHNKRRPFHCSFCGYTAASRSALRMHNRQHTGEKPFSCDECNYTTADHNSLRRHKMRHSGNKPYQCPHCSYACIQSTTYKAHLKNKHPGLDEGLMFCCPECNFRTVKKDNLLAHMAEHNINGVNSDELSRKNNHSNSSLPKNSLQLLSSSSVSKNASSNLRSHVAPTSMSSDNALALQSLVKQVSSSILPTDQLERVLTDSSQTLQQESTLVSLGIKKEISLSGSQISVNNQLPAPGLSHVEIIISDPLHLEDSETESVNGELIVPESQGR